MQTELDLLLRAKKYPVTQPAKEGVIEAVPDQKHCLEKTDRTVKQTPAHSFSKDVLLER